MPHAPQSIRSGDITLQGALHTPAGAGPFPTVVVCHPHPQYGGDMSNNVVMAVVAALEQRGIAALRFNFRGVGGSGGRYGGGTGEQDDVRAALLHAANLPEVDATRLGLAGYSFGSMMAVQVADPSVPALALIALPLGLAGDPEPILSAYPHPLLLVAGDEDQFCPAEAFETLGELLGERAETHIVPGVDHFWFGEEQALDGLVGGFFARHLGAQ